MTETSVGPGTARTAVADATTGRESDLSATRIDAGTNAVYRVDAPEGSYVVKFSTFSGLATMAAEVEVYRLLADAPLPAPRVVDAVLDPPEGPAHVVMAAVPGETPTEVTPSLATQLGRHLHGFAAFDADVEGYGRLHYAGDAAAVQSTPITATSVAQSPTDASVPLVAETDSWRTYVDGFLDHILSRPSDRFTDLVDPVRDVVDRTLSAVPDAPEPAVAYHDYRPANVHVDADGDVVGILDLERADLGDVRYTLVDAEYLLTRHRPADQAARLRDALYRGYRNVEDGYDTAVPERLRACYRALAVAREIRAFDVWWADDPNADEKAADVRAVVRELTG